MTTSEIEPWEHPDIASRIQYLRKTPRLGGVQVQVRFTNGYGLSVINFGGQDVEVMVLNQEDGTVAGRQIPVTALPWIWKSLQYDSVIGHLTPDELVELVCDVAYWPALVHTDDEDRVEGILRHAYVADDWYHPMRPDVPACRDCAEARGHPVHEMSSTEIVMTSEGGPPNVEGSHAMGESK
jgi:hypothetical protein